MNKKRWKKVQWNCPSLHGFSKEGSKSLECISRLPVKLMYMKSVALAKPVGSCLEQSPATTSTDTGND